MDPARSTHWRLVSLRPQHGHAPLRRAAAAHGIGVLALSPWRLQPRDDDASRAALALALDAAVVLFTSPAAVAAAARLQPLLRRRPDQVWAGVGAGTAAALRRAGVDAVLAPQRMDSEGLLALPALAGPRSAGLVTAPGGRGMIAATLAARGTELRRADVYERLPLPPSARAITALRTLRQPLCVALSSEEAIRHVLATLPVDAAATLRGAGVAAASARLATLAGSLGMGTATVAASARPVDLVAAAREAMGTPP